MYTLFRQLHVLHSCGYDRSAPGVRTASGSFPLLLHVAVLLCEIVHLQGQRRGVIECTSHRCFQLFFALQARFFVLGRGCGLTKPLRSGVRFLVAFQGRCCLLRPGQVDRQLRRQGHLLPVPRGGGRQRGRHLAERRRRCFAFPLLCTVPVAALRDVTSPRSDPPRQGSEDDRDCVGAGDEAAPPRRAGPLCGFHRVRVGLECCPLVLQRTVVGVACVLDQTHLRLAVFDVLQLPLELAAHLGDAVFRRYEVRRQALGLVPLQRQLPLQFGNVGVHCRQ